ncbi:hypothetical protein [Frankia sp. R43]|uniref:hypothetical protein n=1 Tax=Frankia sp. R43 TaxID=269536 RepID=UPI00128EF890|nr:hypothetical protein [Frankia sp. R43]
MRPQVPDREGLLIGGLERGRGQIGEAIAGFDFLPLDEVDLIRAGVGVIGLSFVGVVVVHLPGLTPEESAIALDMAAVLRAMRLEVGADGKVVTAGRLLSEDELPPDLKVVEYPVRVVTREADRLVTVVEIIVPRPVAWAGGGVGS